jgi:hypothetical protein
MHEGYRVLQTGTRVPGAGSATSVLLAGSKNTLTAPDLITGTTGTVYEFLFWDIAGHLHTQRTATFTAPAHQAALAATAWYLQTGGGPCTIPTGCPTGVTAYGFSLVEDAALAGTPIASVTPSSAWTAPSATVWTTTSVTMTATNPLEFVRWLARDATATGVQLAVGAGVSTIAIAFYGPNPCQDIENEMAATDPGEFGPPDPVKEYQAYLHYLAEEYQACVARHGGAASSLPPVVQ